jgi:hypothetical protein
VNAVWYRFRAELRTRWRAWLGLALLIGMASGAVLALAAGARRTDTAYSRFLESHNAYDVAVINYPDDETAVFDFDELEQLPQVADSARANFEYYTFDAGNLVSRDGSIGTDINTFKILDGRRADPGAPDEIVVGFALAEDEGLEVGDTVELIPPEFIELYRLLGADENEALMVRLRGGDAAVDGFLGEFEARSGGLSPEVVVQRDHAVAVQRSMARELFLRLDSGADAGPVLADLNENLDEDVFPFSPGEPTDIVNFGRVEALPFVLGAVLAAISAATLAHVLFSAARRRRRDLAVLKTLGFVRRDLRTAVGFQATTIVCIALLIGVPIGIAAGRWVWTLLADDLGVLSQPRVPMLLLLATVAAAVALANLIALWPARVAARTPVANVLRSE